MTTLQLIFYQAHELARREMGCDIGRRFYGTYRAAFADALRAIYEERKQDDVVKLVARGNLGFSRASRSVDARF